MNNINHAKFVDPDNSIYEILGLLYIQLPPRIWWHSEDFQTANYFGHLFRGVFDTGPKIERAYILIADVTDDPDEPDISEISNELVPEVDRALRVAIENELPTTGVAFVKWMGSQLNFWNEKNILVTAYIIDDPEVGHRQRICSRLSIKGRKIAIEVCFNISDADILAAPLFRAMHPVGFV